MKWDVTCWYIVEAKDQAEARAKVLAGDYLDMDVEDIEEYQEPLDEDSPLRRDPLGIIWGDKKHETN